MTITFLITVADAETVEVRYDHVLGETLNDPLYRHLTDRFDRLRGAAEVRVTKYRARIFFCDWVTTLSQLAQDIEALLREPCVAAYVEDLDTRHPEGVVDIVNLVPKP